MAIDDSERETVNLSTVGDHSDVTEYMQLAADLRERVDGEVRFDEYAQVLYATDGSIYRAKPAGVVHPRTASDVKTVVQVCAKHGVPILARGAGSSLGGQAVGPGCVILDMTSHMDEILAIDPEQNRARVQPGVVQDHLDDKLAEHGLKFAPDPASSNRATIGGGIGNNSTGAHSVRYGITDAYVDQLKVVLADGTLITTREVVLDSPEWEKIVQKNDREAELYQTVRSLVEENEDEIESRYPTLKRNVSGYNLNKVIYEGENGERVINLSKLLVGSESTLGVIVEATVELVTVPEETALALYCFDDLIEALAAVPIALRHNVSAVELMDEEVFRLARASEQYAEYEEPIPEGTAASLMIEWDSELVDGFAESISELNDVLITNGDAFDVIEAYSSDDQAAIWKLRKAAIPLLMGLEGDPKPYPFIEDATVPPEELADYVQEFEDILSKNETSAAYFAHAGSGTLHIRPVLNLKDDTDIQTMKSITEDVTDLVLKRDGSFSGEHGDGLARTEFNRKMYGEQLWDAFLLVKDAFDPDWRMNPGKVVYQDENPTDMRENLRYGAEYQSIEPQTKLDFTEEGGFSHLVELCNGCGTCRQKDTDVMCPTYRATKEEVATTRGRANMLRAAISGEISEDELYSERFQKDVLDLCVGCKGCKSDCPTGVDLAKLKAEVKHQYYQREGPGVRERLFGNIDRLSSIGSSLAPLSNLVPKLPGSDIVSERVFGIAPDRTLPSFQRQSLENWHATRETTVRESKAERKVILFPDTYSNYSNPDPGKATIRVLEAAGVHVAIPDELGPSGRAAYSVGLLDTAAERAQHNIDLFEQYIEDGWEIVGIEPSDVAMFRDEYRTLVSDPAIDQVVDHSYGVMEYLDFHDILSDLERSTPTESLVYHGHCHQKAEGKAHHDVTVLEAVGYDVDDLDSGCCGMAGSFGYEVEHYEVSKAVGSLLFEQIDTSPGQNVVAPGTSCRTQISDRENGSTSPAHPIEKVEEVLITE